MAEFENDMLDDEIDSNENYLTLTDDSGEEIHFEVLDEFQFKGKDYIVLIPFEDLDDEVVILEVIKAENGDDDYVSVTDEDLLLELFEEFKTRNSDMFDFE